MFLNDPSKLASFLSEQSETQRTVNRVIDRYNHLGSKLGFRQEELEAYLNLAKLYADRVRVMNDQFDWVTSVEQQLDNQGPLSNDISTLEDQYNKMKVSQGYCCVETGPVLPNFCISALTIKEGFYLRPSDGQGSGRRNLKPQQLSCHNPNNLTVRQFNFSN